MLTDTTSSLADALADLYQQQLVLDPKNQYLIEHGQPRAILNQVLTFQWYAPHLPAEGVILDWGCNHAPDSCLLRARFGDRYQLHGCDFRDAGSFPAFHDFGQLTYTKLNDNVVLPYAPDTFDVVIGSGALEHTAQDYESLRQLYRVLKPNGVLIVSYLPNWLSHQEWVRRVVRKKDFHRRLYGLGEARQLLKRCGLYPVEASYHSFFWEHKLSRLGVRRGNRPIAQLLYRLLPTMCPTLSLVARKVLDM